MTATLCHFAYSQYLPVIGQPFFRVNLNMIFQVYHKRDGKSSRHYPDLKFLTVIQNQLTEELKADTPLLGKALEVTACVDAVLG